MPVPKAVGSTGTRAGAGTGCRSSPTRGSRWYRGQTALVTSVVVLRCRGAPPWWTTQRRRLPHQVHHCLQRPRALDAPPPSARRSTAGGPRRTHVQQGQRTGVAPRMPAFGLRPHPARVAVTLRCAMRQTLVHLCTPTMQQQAFERRYL
jgi:hypothetical protein